ncbi:uncharacterized protein LOC135101645 isoform X2 [Scylla paramamosain]|uniref:uncharacterized protein LOC135101645 isoform X2 n=1 Tax=Scylla paramamosain TaxID=85552 RepID=UPI0030830FF2
MEQSEASEFQTIHPSHHYLSLEPACKRLKDDFSHQEMMKTKKNVFECPICKVQMSTRQALWKHKKRKHPEATKEESKNKNSLQCMDCEFRTQHTHPHTWSQIDTRGHHKANPGSNMSPANVPLGQPHWSQQLFPYANASHHTQYFVALRKLTSIITYFPARTQHLTSTNSMANSSPQQH